MKILICQSTWHNPKENTIDSENLIITSIPGLVDSQYARMAYAKSEGIKIGFVERTWNTNAINGPCPHYLPTINKIGPKGATYHRCEQCGYRSPTYIKPYENEQR